MQNGVTKFSWNPEAENIASSPSGEAFGVPASTDWRQSRIMATGP